jgi:hypothetical protein
VGVNALAALLAAFLLRQLLRKIHRREREVNEQSAASANQE